MHIDKTKYKKNWLSSLGIKKRDDLYIFENHNILTFVNKDVIIKVEALDKPKLIFLVRITFFKNVY